MYKLEDLEMQEDNKTRKILREYPEYDCSVVSPSDLTDSSSDSSDDSMNRVSDQSFEDTLEDLSEDSLGDLSEDSLEDTLEDLSPEMSKGFIRSKGSERYISLSYNIIDMIRLVIAACLSFGLTYLMYYVSVYSVIILCTILITTMISIELGNDQYNDYSLNIPRNE